MIEKINPKIIPYDNAIRSLCRLPYKGHAKGCQNFGCRETCPPKLPLVNEVFDFSKDIYIIYTEFKVGEFAEKMKLKHGHKSGWDEKEFPQYHKKGRMYVEKVKSILKNKNPDWTEKYFPKKNPVNWKSSGNWYNPRRWQETDRFNHRQEVKNFMEKYPGFAVSQSPEALGVNLTGLMSKLGIDLSWVWPPEHNLENKTFRISIAGVPKESFSFL